MDFKVGLELHQQGKVEEAKAVYEAVLLDDPKHFDAMHLLGVAYLELHNPAKAIDLMAKAILINPNDSSSCSNLGNALLELKKYEEALYIYTKAISIDPNSAVAYYNRGNAFRELGMLKESADDYTKAIEINPNNPQFFYNHGNVLRELGRLERAKRNYEVAIALDPAYEDVYVNLGHTLNELGKLSEAVACYNKALELDPENVFLPGTILHSKMKLCDWSGFDVILGELSNDVRGRKKILAPLSTLSLLDSPKLHKQFSRVYTKVECPEDNSLGPIIPVKNKKIKVGYYSADFRSHAVAYLTAGLFEVQDTNKFEFVAFQMCPDKGDRIQKRIYAAFGSDKVINVEDRSDEEIALMSRHMGIDIAVNLGGHTKDARTKAFAKRCAPIQVNYLGYAGTMGAEYMDYIIADKIVIPKSRRNDFVEKVVYLPDCYQANDSKREVSGKVYTREEQGLPETGFVFCCFNNLYKILPDVFDSWMRILKAVPDSVLWLKVDNDEAVENINREALNRGVDSSRLVFSKHIRTQADHLARHKLADLFIDTFPYTAHTTASDSLWSGVPLLTRVGKSFASRVAASLLTAVWLPEMIVKTTGQYEAMAIDLALNPAKLERIRSRLESNKLRAPLFNTEVFSSNLERIYTIMYNRKQEGLPPCHI